MDSLRGNPAEIAKIAQGRTRVRKRSRPGRSIVSSPEIERVTPNSDLRTTASGDTRIVPQGS